MPAALLTTTSPMPPHPVGLELFRKAKAITGHDKALIAFSNGKNAVAAWLAMRDHFEIAAYYLELVPGLSFIEESLTYYERLFGVRIERVPHPSILRMVRNAVFQPPERLDLIDRLEIRPGDYSAINDDMKRRYGWPLKTLCATGLRIQDSLLCRTSIKRHGPITLGVQKFYPVWDWSMDHMIQQFRRTAVKLPVDYRVFGRSFDGLAGYYLVQIAKHWPADWLRILELYPMAEAELRRYQKWAAA